MGRVAKTPCVVCDKCKPSHVLRLTGSKAVEPKQLTHGPNNDDLVQQLRALGKCARLLGDAQDAQVVEDALASELMRGSHQANLAAHLQGKQRAEELEAHVESLEDRVVFLEDRVVFLEDRLKTLAIDNRKILDLLKPMADREKGDSRSGRGAGGSHC